MPSPAATIPPPPGARPHTPAPAAPCLCGQVPHVLGQREAALHHLQRALAVTGRQLHPRTHQHQHRSDRWRGRVMQPHGP
jgi:hypothetical protein